MSLHMKSKPLNQELTKKLIVRNLNNSMRYVYKGVSLRSSLGTFLSRRNFLAKKKDENEWTNLDFPTESTLRPENRFLFLNLKNQSMVILQKGLFTLRFTEGLKLFELL